MTTTDIRLHVNEYDEQAAKFLLDTGSGFMIEYVDEACPRWEHDDKHIHGNHYKFTLTNGARSYTGDFWNSYADALKGGIKLAKLEDLGHIFKYHEMKATEKSHAVKPSVYDVLTSLQSYVPESFDDFCSNFGYDTDSRRAEATYQAVKEQVTALQTLFSDDEMQMLADIA